MQLQLALTRRAWGDSSVRCRRRGRRVYIRCIQILGRLDGDGRAAQGAMAPVRPHRVAGARAPRAVGAALAVDARLVPRHGRGGAAALPDAARLSVVGGVRRWVRAMMAAGSWSRAARAGGPRTAASSRHGAATVCTWGSAGTGARRAGAAAGRESAWQCGQGAAVAITGSCSVEGDDGWGVALSADGLHSRRAADLNAPPAPGGPSPAAHHARSAPA